MTKKEKEQKLKELKKKASNLKQEVDYYNAMQLALKLVLNGSYGAMAAPYFILFNEYVAGTITAQGRDLTQTMDKVNEEYWYNKWHSDKELHKTMFLKNVTKINNKEDVSIYADTDSCDSDTIIQTDKKRTTIEKWYNDNIKNGNGGKTEKGHESVLTNDKILNYDNKLYYAKVKRIIRHKVTKSKWKLRTKNGKEIIITNDHSLIVFRQGKKIEVKPSQVMKTDKVLIVKNNVYNTEKYEFVEIESCEEIGEFKDEYVYDVEVDDSTHTFIANDILVHNSIFVSFYPAIKNCKWKNNFFNKKFFTKYNKPYLVISDKDFNFNIDNKNYKGFFNLKEIENKDDEEKIKILKDKIINCEKVIVDGCYVKNRYFNNNIKEHIGEKLVWNWTKELDFIQGMDYYRFNNYFKKCLDEYAAKFGVENKEDFELERISESIINMSKKKYIQHILHEDGVDYDKLEYIFPKGVELIRSSTPLFAREKIIIILKYLFKNPDSFDIKQLTKLVKDLRKEFEVADIEEISMQSSMSNYEEKVLEDKKYLNFVTGTHFAVKASAYHNYLLHKNSKFKDKYDFIKSGEKIKYYYTKDKTIEERFAFPRGSFPIEFAPEIDYDIQFMKSILSPINSIIEPLGLPKITKRLKVVMSILSGF